MNTHQKRTQRITKIVDFLVLYITNVNNNKTICLNKKSHVRLQMRMHTFQMCIVLFFNISYIIYRYTVVNSIKRQNIYVFHKCILLKLSIVNFVIRLRYDLRVA